MLGTPCVWSVFPVIMIIKPQYKGFKFTGKRCKEMMGKRNETHKIASIASTGKYGATGGLIPSQDL